MSIRPPKISIGIPTFNRVNYLRESLGSALTQTLRDIEIIIADNASTDGTEEFVLSINDKRVKYFKHDKNYGAGYNRQSVIDMSSAEYFLWFNDDDIIFPDLALRAYEAFQQNPDASMYSSYTLYDTDIGAGNDSHLAGPPFKLNWKDGNYRIINGNLLLPVCLCYTPALFPGVLFRIDVLRRVVAMSRGYCPLLDERFIIGCVAKNSKVIVDPYIGGWYRYHPEQLNINLQKNKTAMSDSSYVMEDEITRLVNNNSEEILNDFEGILNEISNDTLTTWCHRLNNLTRKSNFTNSVFVMLSDKCNYQKDKKFNLTSMKSVLKILIPPILWDMMRIIKEYFKKE